ncbi:MAG: XRE family transcriptional regulator [Oscillospiraceae bacterium]
MGKSLGETLNALRREAGLTQPRVSELLALRGIDIQTAGISKWEKGLTQPSAQQFLALCSIYSVRDVMGVFTGSASTTDALNAEGRRLVADYTRVLIASRLYPYVPECGPGRVLPLYALAASAGTGQFLDGDDYETVEVGDEVPARADFGVRIAGDSMEPLIADGAVVWVRRSETLANGSVGVFCFNGQSYCKKLETGANGVSLVSINPNYAPIRVTPASELVTFGEVVGVS